jgi:hypothetical protein
VSSILQKLPLWCCWSVICRDASKKSRTETGNADNDARGKWGDYDVGSVMMPDLDTASYRHRHHTAARVSGQPFSCPRKVMVASSLHPLVSFPSAEVLI